MAKRWYVYLIRCCDNSIYCGVTTHLKHRIARHSDAFKMEYKIKQIKKIDKVPFMEKL
jgi:putative endonuclease